MSQEVWLMIIPAFMAGLSLLWKSPKTDRRLIFICAVFHLFLTVTLPHASSDENKLFRADSLTFIFLMILSILFVASAVHSITFLRETAIKDYNRWYAPAMLLFLSSMTGVVLSRNMAMMWVFVEATTLSTASLIHHSKTRASLEATWKYLFICSIGIALAFIGVIALYASTKSLDNVTLNIDFLIHHAHGLSPLWLKLSFVFALIGYGTKMGLAPMHTWLPDAYSQAPSPASALFAGALENCAFLAILRFYQIMVHTVDIGFSKQLLIVIGLLSVLVCSVYVLRVRNFKRMLAYSSIEHMGILATGIGIGGLGVYAAVYHAICHSLTKHALFLTAGNFRQGYKTILIREIKGGMMRMPVNSWILIIGITALLGLPPFGIFISKLTLMRQMVHDSNWLVLSVFIVLLIVVFYCMLKAVISMTLSRGDEKEKNKEEEPLLSVLPQIIFMAALIGLGTYIPKNLNRLLLDAASLLQESLK